MHASVELSAVFITGLFLPFEQVIMISLFLPFLVISGEELFNVLMMYS